MFALSIIICLIAGCFAQPSEIATTSSSASASSSANSKDGMYKGPCPDITTKPANFYNHSGLWYEVARSINNEHGTEKCHRILWRTPVNNKSEVIHKSYNPSTSTTQTLSSMAEQGPKGFEFTHHFPTIGDIVTIFFPLDFNSSRYSIVWNCENRGNKHLEKMYVFARDKVPMEDLDKLLSDVYKKYNISPLEMAIHDHSNCDVYFASYRF